jgi:penicillin-binding protein activator
MKNLLNHGMILAAVLGLTACGGFKAQRMDDKGIDEKSMEVTDEWVDGDNQIAVTETLAQIHNHHKFQKLLASRNGKPLKLFVGEIRNNTSEPYFPAHDLEEALLVKLSDSEDFTLIDAKQREALKKEIHYQNDGNVRPEDIKKLGRESGADAILFGTVNMDPKRRDGKTVKEYAVNFRLTDLQSTEELVRTRKVVNKFSKQSGSGW